jgi:hypothetical protein
MLAKLQKLCHCASRQGSSRPASHFVGHFRAHCSRPGQLLVARAAADDSAGGDALDEPFLNKLDMGVVYSQQHGETCTARQCGYRMQTGLVLLLALPSNQPDTHFMKKAPVLLAML